MTRHCHLSNIMEKINNKEIINLLDSLSESESDASDLVLTPRKKKVKRRVRPAVRVKRNKSCSCDRSQSRTVSLWLAGLLITFWLIALSWLAAVLYSEIGRIDVSIRSENLTFGNARTKGSNLDLDSSDERSEYWNLTTRVNRKCRGRRGRACPGLLRACSAFFACASVLATASLIWLFIDVRQQLSALRTELDQVRAGSEGVPDALQKCHSLSRDLQNNQTTIFTQLSELKLQINNFTVQLSGIRQGLHRVQESLQAAPELTNVPKNMKELSTNVASFGSQIRDLGATVKTLKETDLKIQDAQTTMQRNITDMQRSLLDLSNVTQRSQLPTNESRMREKELNEAISQLTSNLTRINETLTRNITWIAEDQTKDHTTIVALQDMTQNATMTVMSLQGECAKASEQSSLVKKLNEQISEVRLIDTKIKQLEQTYTTLKNSASAMQASITDMRSQQKSAAKARVPQEYEISTTPPGEHGNSEADESSSTQRKLFKPKRFNVIPQSA